MTASISRFLFSTGNIDISLNDQFLTWIGSDAFMKSVGAEEIVHLGGRNTMKRNDLLKVVQRMRTPRAEKIRKLLVEIANARPSFLCNIRAGDAYKDLFNH